MIFFIFRHLHNVLTFLQYERQCFDISSKPVGTNGNLFNSRCECISGFRSSNPMGGSILRKVSDRCEPCSDLYCGDRPTISPTAEPTRSIVPSFEPTRSMRPSVEPSVSSSPSTTPTTQEPSPSPSISSIPSDSPSADPSSFKSLYDGEYCERDQECIIESCINSVCRGSVSFMN